jgi:DNA gyrase subunit B
VTIVVNGSEYSESFKPYEMEFIAKVTSQYPDVKNKEATFLVSCRFNDDFDMTGSSGSINGLIVNQGYHINYAKAAFRQAYNHLFGGFNYFSKEDKGLEFSVICMCAEPEFSSQTKERCVAIQGIEKANAAVVFDAFVKLIKKNYEKFALHNKKLVEFINSTKDLSRLEFIKSKVAVVGLDGDRRTSKLVPSNVKTCSSKDRKNCDLFIVEGRSAAGSVIKARDSKTQAVMALRGKPMNGAGLDIIDILKNEELKDLIATIGTGIDERFSLEKVQYGKIIITADADPDGANIASLVLGLFFSHMKYLIKAGMVYISDSPLYKQGDKYYYEGEFDLLDKTKPFQRYKGLGELNPEDVKATITNPETRRLIQVTDNEDDMEFALRLITTTYARKSLLMKAGVIEEGKLLTSDEILAEAS